MKNGKRITLIVLCLCVTLLLSGCVKSTSAKYEDAKKYIISGEYDKAVTAFTEIDGYEDSSKYLTYVKAIQMAENGQYDLAISTLTTLGDFSDSKMLSIYYQAQRCEKNQEYEQADTLYRTIAAFKDSTARIAALPDLILDREFASAKSFLETYGYCYDMLNLLSKTYSTDVNKMKRQIYDVAQEQLEKENFNNAYSLFQALANVIFSDSNARVKDTVCAYAQRQIEQENYQSAFTALSDYPEELAQEQETLYQKAVTLRTSGEYDRAIQLFSELGSYKDALEQISETQYQQASEAQYQQAIALNNAGDYAGAYSIFATIKGYKDVDNLLSTDENLQAAALDAKFSVESYVTFGTYPQTAEGVDNTPIEWLVLARDGNKALLISRYGLDAQPYNTSYASVKWEKCTLRTWLNTTFLNKAFTSEERKGIVLTYVDNSKNQCYSEWDTNGGKNTQDKIFLLSYVEANKYFYGIRNDNAISRLEPTAYAIAQGAWTGSICKTESGKYAGWWWLRSPGYFRTSAACVYADGSLDSDYVDCVNGCVRPALWVNLESDIFQSGN